LISEDDRVGHFVQLQAATNRRPIDFAVLGEGAIGLLPADDILLCGGDISLRVLTVLLDVLELLTQQQDQYDLAITGKQNAKTTLDNVAKFQEDLRGKAKIE
jgi:hypothetical protein